MKKRSWNDAGTEIAGVLGWARFESNEVCRIRAEETSVIYLNIYYIHLSVYETS